MTVGYHAPPRSAASGVADYAWRLAGELQSHCRLQPDSADAQVHLYHLGNNQLHWRIYQQALARPGVILLHDANLHHMHLGALPESEYVAEFCRQYGAWHHGLAQQLWQGRALSACDPAYFRYTLLKRAAASARAVIVHNQAARERVLEVSPQTPVEMIPHFTTPADPPGAQTLIRLRAALDLEASHFAVGIFGFLRESKRLAPALRAFNRARRAAPHLRLLIAGTFCSAGYEQALQPLLEQPGVIRVPYLPRETDFHNLIHAADACLNLRYPSCGESSGIAARAMSAGKPMIVTTGNEWRDLPEDSHLSVDAGPAEEEMLRQAMVALASHRPLAATMGRQARRHAGTIALAAIAARVAAILEKYQK